MIIPNRWTQKYSANGIATGFKYISLFGLINPTGNKAEELQIIFWVQRVYYPQIFNSLLI